MKSAKVGLQDIISLAVLALIWGSSFILIKRSLLAFNPIQVGTLRVIISMLVLLPLAMPRRKIYVAAPKNWILAVGLVGSAIPAILFSYAQTRIDSSLAGLLNTLTPIWVLILGTLFFGLKVTRHKVMGVALGFVGAFILIYFNAQGTYENMFYGLLVVISTLCYATSVNIIKAKLASVDALSISVYSYIMAGLLVLPVLFLGTSVDVLEHPDFKRSLIALSILALFGTAIGSIIFFRLTQRTDQVFASMVTYLIPIIALGWGLWDGEAIGLYHIIGMSIILSGVWLSSRS